MTLEEFIISHSEDDTSRLILGRDKWPDVDVPLAVNIIECRRKIRQKLPEWYAVPGLIYPDRICAEQSSSSFTANYKASVAGRILSSVAADGRRIADLTGGLGVDSLAFSAVADKVLYNEMEPSRASAARHNFPLLGAQDIVVTSHCVSAENDAVWTELKSFGPSLIYMDPARRSSSGSKVFLLEDCSPDVLTLTRRLFEVAPNLLIKLSPMADISMLVNRLRSSGAFTKEVHVVAHAGECKELLLWLVPDTREEGLSTRLIVNENGSLIEPSGEASIPLFLENEEHLSRMKYIFEPGKALIKAGIFNEIGTLFSSGPASMLKAGKSTHLYLYGEEMTFDIDPKNFGKVYEIIGWEHLDKRAIKAFASKYPSAEVTARNIPMTSDELRRKLKCQSGGDVHIFGLRLDFTAAVTSSYLFAARRSSALELNR